MLCIAEKITFSAATAHTGSGHITRSSISRVMPKSCAKGNATAAMPENMIATAIKPGSRIVPKPPLPAAIFAIGFRFEPLVICGITNVNTNRNSSGFMHTRIANGNNSRRSTYKSRRNNAANARAYIVEFPAVLVFIAIALSAIYLLPEFILANLCL